MNFLDQIHRIEIIDEKIRSQKTSSPKKLALDLDISESQLYLTLATMKKLGASFFYSKERQSYCYTTKNQRFVCGF